MTATEIIRNRFDVLLHPSARHDALTAAQHRQFMSLRLVGSLIAFAAFPVYLALRGAPSAIEVIAFAWLVAPILLSWYLSRTGCYERAHALSSLAVAGLIMLVAIATGGVTSPAAIWLVLVPAEAALSASRRVVAFASALVLACALTLVALGQFDLVPASGATAVFNAWPMSIGIVSATLCAAGIAFIAQSLSRASVSQLHDEEGRYRLLAGNMSDAISRHGRNGVVEFVSPAAECLFGAPPSRLLGHGLFDRVHVTDRPAYLTALSNAARGNEDASVEFRARRGSTDSADRRTAVGFVWIEMRCRRLEQPYDRSDCDVEVVAVMRDVTERKAQEQALEQARAETERADASKTRFLATMSHELRTPLNAIIGFSEMIVREDDLCIDAARRKEYAQLINESGQHLLAVVNGILDMSKIEAGTFEVSPELFAPRAVLINSCNLLALKASESGIDLTARAADDLPDITADPRALKQIIVNLVSNAIKFTDRGGSVVVSATVQGSRLVLRVADTGVGIGTEDLKQIGKPFFQAGKTYQRRHEGTGLGLSIVKSLVEMQGGEMAVQSRIDVGTTVSIALPLHFAAPASRQDGDVATLVPVTRAEQPDHQVKKSA